MPGSRPMTGAMRLRRCLLLLLVVGLAAPATAEAAPRRATPELIDAAEQRGAIGADIANLYRAFSLAEPARLPDVYRSESPWDGTLVLLELRRDLRAMPRGRARERIEDTISAQHALTTCDTSAAPLTSSFDSAFFHIDYDTIGAGLDINDYAASLDASWSTEVTTFGWAAPPVLPSNPPPGNRYHVRVEPLGPGLYGFVSSAGTHAGFVGNNPNTPWNDGDALASCMVLNSDYSAFGDAQAALDATTAHEFNHSIQYGYGAAQGPNTPDEVFFEGGATWMEDEVHDTADDSYNYLWPVFAYSMGEYDDSPYAYWIAFRGLTERFGTGTAGGGEDVMQEFWERTSQNLGSNLSALGAAMATQGTTLDRAFHDYAIAVKYNRACVGGYVLPHCFEEAAGYLGAAGATPVHRTIGAVGAGTSGTVEDNYAINWVALPSSGSGYRVTLQNTSAGGSLRGTVVCDSGTDLDLFPLPAVVGSSGSHLIEGFSTAACSSPVLVITNEAQTAPNPPSSAARSYTVSTAPSASTSPLSVTRAGTGSGTVSSSPAGIDCGPDCAANYADGMTVTLSATPATGSRFAGWAGDCGGTGACVVSMSAARAVTAQFAAIGGAGSDGPTGGGGSAADVLAPSFTRLSLSARRFRAARSGSSVAGSVGSRVRFRLSEAARVRFRVERRVTGRRVGGRCRAATRRTRSRPRCLRWVRVRGSFSVNAAAGERSFRFRGRVRGRSLRPGAYRLVGVARDGAGNRSAARRTRFRIIRR